MYVQKFRKLTVWQRSIAFVTDIYQLTSQFPKEEKFGLIDQIRRASVSVASNIAEGFERESNNQFVYFLTIAKASAGEVRTQLYIARNQKYITEEKFSELYQKVKDVSKTISGFISYLREIKRKAIVH